MKLLTRDFTTGCCGAGPANQDPVFLGMDFDLISREPGQFRAEHELARGLVQIDRGGPARRVGANELSDLFVKSEQITERIPPGKGHVRHRSMIASRATTCATIARLYGP